MGQLEAVHYKTNPLLISPVCYISPHKILAHAISSEDMSMASKKTCLWKVIMVWLLFICWQGAAADCCPHTDNAVLTAADPPVVSRPLIKERWQNIQYTGWNLCPPAETKKDQITSSQSQGTFRTVDSRLVILSHFIHQFLIFLNSSLSSTVSFGLHHDVEQETSFLFWHHDHTNGACICAVRRQDNKLTSLCRHLVVKYMRATCYSSNWWHSSFFLKTVAQCVF